MPLGISNYPLELGTFFGGHACHVIISKRDHPIYTEETKLFGGMLPPNQTPFPLTTHPSLPSDAPTHHRRVIGPFPTSPPHPPSAHMQA